MPTNRERRAAALEAIANALLELAAIEREPETSAPAEVLIHRKNCRQELGLPPAAFLEAAGREFAAFRVSRRVTATKADVLGWLKTRGVTAKPPRARDVPERAPMTELERDEFLRVADAKFVSLVGRPMTDYELYEADMHVDVGRLIAHKFDRAFTDTPDDVAVYVRDLKREPLRYGGWRSLGLDPADMERKADELREKLYAENPRMGWRERMDALWEMWGEVTEPLEEARRLAREEKRAARKAANAEKAKLGQLGLKR
jgi:hypothetical protein